MREISSDPNLFENTSEQSALSVSDLNKQIKMQLESEFPLVWVQGELSNFTAHRSGHWYFSLKDANSQISAVMFKGHNARLKFKAEAGMEVLVRARVNVYEPRGSYQLNVEIMEPVGAGALQKQFEQLKKKLALEGLFEASRKKQIPSFPKKIAIVTSPTGAAIRDMIHVLERRYPLVEISLFPCKVQGDTAAKEIKEALEFALRLGGFDLILLGRGGGSIEDLWCFNDEALARRIASSEIPIISAVGHEIDFTISDFVADLRAPTPSAAAEMAVPNKEDLALRIARMQSQLLQSILKLKKERETHLKSLLRILIDPKKEIERRQQVLDELMLRLDRAIRNQLSEKRSYLKIQRKSILSPSSYIDLLRENTKQLNLHLLNSLSRKIEKKKQQVLLQKELQAQMKAYCLQKRSQLAMVARGLNNLSPLSVLDRGYSIALEDKVPIKSVNQIEMGKEFELKLSDGSLRAKSLGKWE